MVIVEAVIIFFTAGAGAAKTAVTLSKLAIKGAKGLKGAATALRSVSKVIKPILQAFQKLKGALATWAKAVVKYIDDLIKWVDDALKKLLARAKRPPTKRPPAKKPPKKPKKPKKPRKKDRDRLRIAAIRGAQRAWSHLVGALGNRVHSKTEVRTKLAGVRIPVARGIRVDLSLSSMGSGWKIKARARKGMKAKSWKKGSGWITTKHKSLEKFYATKSYKQLHKDIIDDAIKELLKNDDKRDQVNDEYTAKKKEGERLEQAGQRRIKLEGVKFTIKMEELRDVEKDLKVKTDLVISPNAVTGKANPALPSAADLEKAKAALKKQLFTTKKLADVLNVDDSIAGNRIQTWKKHKQLYAWQTKERDPKTEYTFDSAMANKKREPADSNARYKYGYRNPDQKSAKGVRILNKGIRADSPHPAPDDDSRYDSMSGGVRKTSGPYSNFPRVKDGDTLAILGHKYPAVLNWNDGVGGTPPGHKRTFQENFDWNQDPDNYHGPEHAEESGREGGTLSSQGVTYEVPRESIDSHPSWWNVV